MNNKVLNPAESQLAKDFEAAKVEAVRAEERVKELRSELSKSMDGNEYAKLDDGTWYTFKKAHVYDGFTDRAIKVMQLANQEAQRFNHEYIGTEHLLLGLTKEGSGVAANVFVSLGVDMRKVRLAVEKIVQSGPEMITIGKLPKTPRAKKVIEYAYEESSGLKHTCVGTEHLLLGMLRETHGIAATVLTEFGLDTVKVRDTIVELLRQGEEALLRADGTRRTDSESERQKQRHQESDVDESITTSKLQEEVSKFFIEILGVLSKVKSTPVVGYETGGGFSRVLSDVKLLVDMVKCPRRSTSDISKMTKEQLVQQRKNIQKFCNSKLIDFYALDAICASLLRTKSVPVVELAFPVHEANNTKDWIGFRVFIEAIERKSTEDGKSDA